MLTPVFNISTDDTSGQLANRIQILEKSLDTLMEKSKNNTQLIIDISDDTASSRTDTHKEEHKDRRSNRPLHGTAHDENGITLAAYIDLVAFGVRKNVTAVALSRFLEKKGLPILDWKLLTTF